MDINGHVPVRKGFPSTCWPGFQGFPGPWGETFLKTPVSRVRGLVPKSGREAKQRRLDFGDGPSALTLSPWKLWGNHHQMV